MVHQNLVIVRHQQNAIQIIIENKSTETKAAMGFLVHNHQLVGLLDSFLDFYGRIQNQIQAGEFIRLQPCHFLG